MNSNNSVYVYDSSQRSPRVLEELQEVIRYRTLIFQLIQRDVVTRYKRSVLGVAWTMLNPLGMMIVLTIAFSQIFRFNTPNYTVYILSGLLVWNFFSQTTTSAMVSLVWGGSLLKRIYIPRSTFALSAMGTGVVNLGLSLVPMFLIMLFTRTPIRWSVFFLPISVLLLLFFALGLGLILSTAAIYFPDVAEMYQILISAWMYLTPIIYPASMLPEKVRFWLELLNPMFRLVQLFRLPLYDGRFPTWAEFWPSLLVSTVMLVFGWFIFTRVSDEFSYRI
jgi:ABC-type polysaccharide/polyol phosphate export permease